LSESQEIWDDSMYEEIKLKKKRKTLLNENNG
jgi:hypothetical protein